MALIIWWLVPVVLLIGLLLMALHFYRPKPVLYLWEPFGLLISAWSLVRLKGETAKLEQLLGWFYQTRGHSETLLDQVLSKPAVNGREKAEHLKSQPLSLLAEQRLVKVNGRVYSIVLGLPAHLGDQLIFNRSEKKELEQLSAQASEHGYLVLAAGLSVVHSASEVLATTHPYSGAVLFEPVISEPLAENIRNLEPKKMLTVLPEGLARFIGEKVNNTGRSARLDAQLTTAQKETRVTTAAILAEAAADSRYQALRFLQLTYRCRLVSALTIDQSLPVEHVRIKAPVA